MVFGQLSFFVFLSIVWIVYFFLNHPARKIWLSIASALFIGYLSLSSLVLVVLTLFISRVSAQAIFQATKAKTRHVYRQLGVFSILGLWISCKVLPYLILGESTTFHYDDNLLLEGFMALGISYYALENIGYLIDLEKKRLTNPLCYLDHLFYTLFFPKLISGPIVRIQQFKENNEPTLDRLKLGGKRIAIGLFKKFVLADRLAPLVSHYFDNGISEYGATNLAALFLFAFQLYFDFSAYTDFAVGIARLFGYELPENFNRPFRSKSISEFWRRWHMSLFDWLRTYIYNPLSFRFRKSGTKGILIALWATFILSGLWHGLGLTFIFYAIFHALMMSLHFAWKRNKKLQKMHITQLPKVPFTFTLVALSFAFFRSVDLPQAFSLFASFKDFLPEKWTYDFLYHFSFGDSNERIFTLGITLFLSLSYLVFERKIDQSFRTQKGSVFLFMMLLLIYVLFGHFGSSQQFIYGQF